MCQGPGSFRHLRRRRGARGGGSNRRRPRRRRPVGGGGSHRPAGPAGVGAGRLRRSSGDPGGGLAVSGLGGPERVSHAAAGIPISVLPGDERGSVTVVTAGMLVVLFVLVLGSADVAKTLAAVGRAQTAADAAALAAAQEQVAPTGPGPQAVAGQYAASNGGTLVSCRCPPDGTEAVVVQVGHMLFLAGLDRVTATARAVVDLGGG